MKASEKIALAAYEAARREAAESAAAVSDVILDAAVKKLDALFGKGFAQANPGLVGQYLDATARTFQNDIVDAAEFGDDLDFDLPMPDTDRRR